MDNLTLLGILITVVWLLVFGYYFYVSRQQREIIDDVDELKGLLESREHGEES